MTFIAFLRAINVGGHNVKMDALRSLFEEIGLTSVKTFIASGNVIFDTKKRDASKLEREIERHLRSSLGYDVETFLRTPAEVAVAAAVRPVTHLADDVHRALYVGFLHDELRADQKKVLMSFKTSTDDFYTTGREVYWTIGGSFSDSKFSNAVLEKKLALRATFRNMTTVTKLAGLYG